MPSSNQARRYQAPSQACSFEVVAQCVAASPRSVRQRAASPCARGQPAKRVQHVVQEEAEPDAFALPLLADAVHAVVPVAGAHQRQAVLAEQSAAASSARTQCSYSVLALRRSWAGRS